MVSIFQLMLAQAACSTAYRIAHIVSWIYFRHTICPQIALILESYCVSVLVANQRSGMLFEITRENAHGSLRAP